MSMFKSLQRLFSGDGAAAVHKRGMAKAKREDWSGAVQDYTEAVNAPNASQEMVAMARFNRALAYAQLREHAKAVEDLQAVIAAPGAPENIRTAAKEKLARWGKRRAT